MSKPYALAAQKGNCIHCDSDMISPCLCTHEQSSREMHASLGYPVQDRYLPIRAGLEEGHKNYQRLAHLSCEERLKELDFIES